jgi:aryl-alcohol dehydrogenase-like predicted oxidoreductase
MDYRILGPTGLEVSNICLGTMQFKWTTDELTSYQVLDAFVEAGGNFIDTADVYTRWYEGNQGGEAETILGQWMKQRGNRGKIVLATKVRGRMWEGPDGEGLSRAHIVRAVEDSLRRLQTDVIDLYQSHSPDKDTPIEETMRAFDDLVKQGKVRHVGCSNYNGDQLAEAIQASKRDGLVEYSTIQPHWSLIERQKFELETYATVKIYGLGIIPYSPLGKGFLTGKYRRDMPLPDSKRVEGLKQYLTPKNYLLLDKLEAIAKARNVNMGQIALAWLLSRDQVVSVIIGANTPTQLKDILGASSLTLSDKELFELHRLTSWSTGILSEPVS